MGKIPGDTRRGQGSKALNLFEDHPLRREYEVSRIDVSIRIIRTGRLKVIQSVKPSGGPLSTP